MRIRSLTLDEVLEIHEILIMDQDEIERHGGILSMDSLIICIGSPSRNVYGLEPFDDVFKKASILMFEIVQLHPFVDGNKRTAYTSGKVFLNLNDYHFEAPIQEILEMMTGIAKGIELYEDLLEFVRTYSRRKFVEEKDLTRIENGSFDLFKPDHLCMRKGQFEEFEISMVA